MYGLYSRAASNQEGLMMAPVQYIEVAQRDIFMEQKMRFGLVFGRMAITVMAILKNKLGPIISNF